MSNQGTFLEPESKKDRCAICGRALRKPESRDRGIGPVCRAKFAPDSPGANLIAVKNPRRKPAHNELQRTFFELWDHP